jgi:hypothetical protein
MTAPKHYDLFVIYNIADPASTATTKRFPSAKARDEHLPILAKEHTEGGPDFQVVPSLKFVRYQSNTPIKGLAVKVKTAVAEVSERRQLPTEPWFLDPATGQHVRQGWTPDQPVRTLKELAVEKAKPPVPAKRRRRTP